MGYEIFQGKEYMEKNPAIEEDDLVLEPEKWYWWDMTVGGTLPNSDPHGPFDTEDDARRDASPEWQMGVEALELDEENPNLTWYEKAPEWVPSPHPFPMNLPFAFVSDLLGTISGEFFVRGIRNIDLRMIPDEDTDEYRIVLEAADDDITAFFGDVILVVTKYFTVGSYHGYVSGGEERGLNLIDIRFRSIYGYVRR